MSYGPLAQRLIEAQESMLGRRAVDVAQSIEGLSVADDGTVEGVDGGDAHDRTVIAALVDEYVSIMGQSAHNRLDDVAAEFEGDLVLPENLGGPAETDDGASTDPGPAGVDGSTTEDGDDAEPGAVTDDAGAAGPSADDADESGYEPAEPDEVVTNIWGAEHESEADEPDGDPSDVDVESVYITVTDESGWEQPVPAGRAIVEAVTNVTDLTEDDLADLSTYVDTHRIVRLLETDETDPVSFEVEGHVVTLHADGGIHVE